MPQPGPCSRPGRIRPWTTWPCGSCPCPGGGVGTSWPLRFFPTPQHCMILRFNDPYALAGAGQARTHRYRHRLAHAVWQHKWSALVCSLFGAVPSREQQVSVSIPGMWPEPGCPGLGQAVLVPPELPQVLGSLCAPKGRPCFRAQLWVRLNYCCSVCRTCGVSELTKGITCSVQC